MLFCVVYTAPPRKNIRKSSLTHLGSWGGGGEWLSPVSYPLIWTADPPPLFFLTETLRVVKDSLILIPINKVDDRRRVDGSSWNVITLTRRDLPPVNSLRTMIINPDKGTFCLERSKSGCCSPGSRACCNHYRDVVGTCVS